MSELELHRALVWLELGLAVPTFLVLRRAAAPYGRHLRGGWGPGLPARLGWILMESPAVLAFGLLFGLGSRRGEVVPLLLLGLWQLHYLQRTFVFPFRLRGGRPRMPLAVVTSGMAFNLLNAYVNARWISHLGTYSEAWLGDPRLLAGVALFGAGLSLNLWADGVLIRLRRPGETGYAIPRGGLFERVSCPNYLGEIVEWAGWALATWSLAGLAFALYTVANLAPRARAHHDWYRRTFPAYPPTRRALVPWPGRAHRP